MSNRTFGSKRKGGLSHNWGAFGGYRGTSGVGYQGSYDGPRKRANPLALVLTQEQAKREWRRSMPGPSEADLGMATKEHPLFDECSWRADSRWDGGLPKHYAERNQNYVVPMRVWDEVAGKHKLKSVVQRPTVLLKYHQPKGTLPEWRPSIITTPKRVELERLVAAYRERLQLEHLANLGVDI